MFHIIVGLYEFSLLHITIWIISDKVFVILIFLIVFVVLIKNIQFSLKLFNYTIPFFYLFVFAF